MGKLLLYIAGVLAAFYAGAYASNLYIIFSIIAGFALLTEPKDNEPST